MLLYLTVTLHNVNIFSTNTDTFPLFRMEAVIFFVEIFAIVFVALSYTPCTLHDEMLVIQIV